MKEEKKFPTGKQHISFSEISAWSECSYRHKLKYIDNIDFSAPNEFSSFGKAIHEACQNYIETREMNPSIALNMMDEEWGTNKFEELEGWKETAKDILEEIPDFMEENFPNWEYVKAEELIKEEINGKDIKFKGFIDAVIKIKDKKGNDLYYIADWKTSTFGWFQKKRRSFLTKTQLIFYKNFWANKHNIPLKQIRCAFIILKRNAKKGKKCDLFVVSVGDKTTSRAFKIINNMVHCVESGIFIKNRLNCTYCDYYETDFCQSWQKNYEKE